MSSLHYLPVTIDALKRSIMPALPPGTRSDAEDLMRILACVFVEETEAPALLERVRHDYVSVIGKMLEELPAQASTRQALVDLREHLSSGGAFDIVQLQQGLGAAGSELAALNRPSAWQTLSRLIGIDKTYAQAAEEAYRDIVSREPAQDEAKLPIQSELAAYLRAQFPEEKHVDVESVRYVKGGFANYTAIVTLKNNALLPRQIVVRADRKGFHPTGISVAYEYPILHAVHEFGVCVPKVYALENKGTVLGTPFFIADFAPGTNIGDFMDVKVRNPAVNRDLAQKLARLHSFPVESLGGEVHGYGKSCRDLAATFIGAMRAAWTQGDIARCGIAIPAGDIAFQWLDRHMDDCGEHRCLIHRDIGFHNMLVEGDQVTAILDWSDTTIGNPADDLAYARMSVEQVSDWDDFLAAYTEADGPLPTAAQINFYSILHKLRWVVFFSLVEANCKLGKAKDVPFVYLVANYLRRCRVRLCENLAAVM